MGEPLAEAVDLARSFRRGGTSIDVVLPVSFRLDAGDRIGLVGPSGSGKTTLLNLIAGLDRPTSGSITWPALGKCETLRPGKIGVAFQSRSLIPSLSCAENVELPLHLLGRGSQSFVRARAALEVFDVADLADKLPEEVSGGQAQRVALARAIVAEPRLLLADEPTGQLDSRSGASTLDHLVAWLDRSGAAIVIATHDKPVSERMSRIWTLDHGAMRQSALETT